MPLDPILEHLERTFADAYRREVEQEENVWRSLPFFATALAVQLAALVGVRDWLSGVTGVASWAAAALLLAAAGAFLSALGFLAASIAPAEFRYVSREPDLLAYAEALRAAEARYGADAADGGDAVAAPDPHAAASALRRTLARQYAVAADHNRAVNRRRAARRTRAGLATLASVLLLMALVALAVVAGRPHGAPTPPPHGPARAAADGGGPQGLVGRGPGATGADAAAPPDAVDRR